jgi:hypothetical protein
MLIAFQADGTVVDASDVPDLVISVISVEMQPATSIDQFPTVVNEPTTHTDVTAGKSAGLGQNSTSTEENDALASNN